MTGLRKNSALAGYRVLDLTDEKRMFCARLLVDMGAEVICFNFFQETIPFKLDITLDIETEVGRKTFRRLVKTVDVLVESYSPGYLKNLGLDYTRLKRINPRLIMASITGFGQDGPYRDYKSSDLIAGAMGGWMYVTGEPETPPLKLYGNQTYYTAALFAATGIMLALRHRHVSGKGQHIDISLQECVAATLDHVLVRYFAEGVVSKRQGSRHWNDTFGIFRCRDGYILLSLFYQWEVLVEWLDGEGMAEDLTDKKWLNPEERREHIDHIVAVLEKWTRQHTVSELIEKGQLMRFPWAGVTSIASLLDNPQLKERGFFGFATGLDSVFPCQNTGQAGTE